MSKILPMKDIESYFSFRTARSRSGGLQHLHAGGGAHPRRRHQRLVHARDAVGKAAPEERLDPAFVYVADLRQPGEGGSYVVRKLSRDAFDALVDEATGANEPAAVASNEPAGFGGGHGDPNADIIIYGASWCGACRSTASFLRQRGVPFQEKDIERDPGARSEMLQKARAAGVSANGIPVIDFRGRILTGFDRATMVRLLDQQARPI